jgi:hypothetical protein
MEGEAAVVLLQAVAVLAERGTAPFLLEEPEIQRQIGVAPAAATAAAAQLQALVHFGVAPAAVAQTATRLRLLEVLAFMEGTALLQILETLGRSAEAAAVAPVSRAPMAALAALVIASSTLGNHELRNH